MFPYNDERKGRFVDLQQNFSEYQNLKMKKNDKPYSDDYISYIENFERFDEIPPFAKKTNYRDYLDHLCNYLTHFFFNSKPLVDHSKIYAEMDEKFAHEWENGIIPGWDEEIKKVRADKPQSGLH